jgi:recombinational DNA repair protein RecT
VIVDATAYVVREGDQFELWEDEQGQRYKYVPDLDWSPKAGAPEDEGVRGAIAILRLPSGRNHCEWLPKRVLDDVRAKSKARKGEVPWKAWYDEMAKKTALRRALKTRQSIEGGEVPPVLGRALELHDAMYDLRGRRTVRTVSPTEEVRRVRGEPE